MANITVGERFPAFVLPDEQGKPLDLRSELTGDPLMLVLFVNLAGKGESNFPGFTEMVFDNCSHLLRSQERFAQTGVGWILRELSRSDGSRVVGFIEANLEGFSREAFKNAIRYLPPEVAERLRRAHLQIAARSRYRK